MILSKEMRWVLLRAISAALAEDHEVVGIPHLVAALTCTPAADESRLSGGMTVFSEDASRVISGAGSHARADGNAMTTRQHLVAALLGLGDPAVTAALAGFDPGADHAPRPAVGRITVSGQFEAAEGTLRLRRP
jgi:hypothetical protein